MAARSWNGPGECSAAARSSIASPAAMAAWSHRDRSWSGSSTRSPASENRAAARACWNVSSAASPHASASPGRLVATTPASQTASPARSRSWVPPSEDTKPSLYISATTASTSPSRSASTSSARHGEGDAGRHDLALGPHDPLGQRALVDQERPRDLRRRHADHRAQGERQPGLGGERRVAAREEQRQPVVGAVGTSPSCGTSPRPARAPVRAARERRLARAAADQVQGVVPRCRLQPGGRVVRRPVAPPRLERLGDRGLHGLLGEVEVVELAGQPGHQQTGLLAQGAREEPVGLLGGRHSNWL